MPNHWPKGPNFSVPKLEEENNSQIIPWTEDIKVVDHYLKCEKENSDDMFYEPALIEIKKEEFDETKPSFFKSEPSESNDSSFDNEDNTPCQSILHAIKKETNDENAATEEFTQESGDQLVLHQCPEHPYNTICKDDCKSHLAKLKKEDETDSKSDTFKCPNCSYQSRTKLQLSVHQVKHESIDKWHSCPSCPFKTHSKKILSVHSRRRHGSKPNNPKQIEIFKCTECSYENGFKGNLKMHQLVHNQSSWLQCPDCAYKTPYPSLLKKHQVRHQGENGEGWHRCWECSYKTPSKYALGCHIIMHKSADKIQWLECSQCSYKTPHQYALRRHQSYKHKDAQEIEWFCCYECSFKTKQKSHLIRHVPKHKEINKVMILNNLEEQKLFN